LAKVRKGDIVRAARGYRDGIADPPELNRLLWCITKGRHDASAGDENAPQPRETCEGEALAGRPVGTRGRISPVKEWSPDHLSAGTGQAAASIRRCAARQPEMDLFDVWVVVALVDVPGGDPCAMCCDGVLCGVEGVA
jgi:hypothetical protein